MYASRAAVLLFVALAVVQYLYFGPLLPDLVASHFDAAGQPDAWMSRSEFLITNLAFVLGMAVLFLGTTSLIDRLPNSWINLPNKDYWLAPDRRVGTLAALRRQLEWLAAATLALLVGTTQLSIEANLTGEPLGNAFWLLFGGYLLILIIWLIRLLRWAYARPPRHVD